MNRALHKNLAQIAREHLHIETLETRRSDSLDFHDVSVWGVKAARRTQPLCRADLPAELRRARKTGRTRPRKRAVPDPATAAPTRPRTVRRGCLGLTH